MKELEGHWQSFKEKHMQASPLTIHMLIDQIAYASTMIDSGCLTYALVSKAFVKKAKLQCMKIPKNHWLG